MGFVLLRVHPDIIRRVSIYHNNCNYSYEAATIAVLLISNRPRQEITPHPTLSYIQEGFEMVKTTGSINPVSLEN